MNRPNWNRRGLPRRITEKERLESRRKSALEARIAKLPEFLRAVARENPGLVA
jgi:hypothetical protein